jgi:hypothetical protein
MTASLISLLGGRRLYIVTHTPKQSNPPSPGIKGLISEGWSFNCLVNVECSVILDFHVHLTMSSRSLQIWSQGLKIMRLQKNRIRLMTPCFFDGVEIHWPINMSQFYVAILEMIYPILFVLWLQGPSYRISLQTAVLFEPPHPIFPDLLLSFWLLF